MRIGLVIYGSPDTVSGGYLYDRKLTAHLRARGDEVEVISIRPASYSAHLLDNFSFRPPSGLDVLIADELVHPSVLFANSSWRRPDKGRAYPQISLIHNLHSSERRVAWKNAIYAQIEKLHLRSVDAHIFNSAATRGAVQRLVGDSKPFVIAPPGGDRLGWLGVQEVRRRASSPGPLRLLFLANVTPLKGLQVVLEALDRLAPGSCTLDVVGSLAVDSAHARAMQQRAAQLSTPVTFHGTLDNQPLIDILKPADVLVLPSYYEGFGIAYLEGMAFGAPAIGTTAGAIPQVITHGENGFLIQPGDSAGLAMLIERLASDRDLLAHMSENALRYFASCPTWEQSAETIRRFLIEIVRRQ